MRLPWAEAPLAVTIRGVSVTATMRVLPTVRLHTLPPGQLQLLITQLCTLHHQMRTTCMWSFGA